MIDPDGKNLSSEGVVSERPLLSAAVAHHDCRQCRL